MNVTSIGLFINRDYTPPKNKKKKPQKNKRGNPCGVVANVLNFDIVQSEFELQSNYYVHFRTNILEKDTNLVTHFHLLFQ